ncbi:MAG: tRNA methyltransferase [Rhodospirillaceae bacterium]|nr:tRNA methyltransferase [Rhodospirillaceae bacterium]
MNIVSFQPDIPQNLGGLIRLTSCFGVKLSVIEPCGFPLGDKGLRRVSMDYFDKANITIFKSWQDFLLREANNGRKVLLTTKSEKYYNKFSFLPDDYLILGNESSGAPDYVHKDLNYNIKIPMRKNIRSLNLVSAASIVLSEALRQNNLLNYDSI